MIIYSMRVPRPLVTVSTAVITVLHSAEVLHFHHEPWFALSPEVISLLTHYQGRSVGFTIKPFKGLSNKLGPLGFQLANICRAPLPNDTLRVGYSHKDRGRTIPDSSSPFCAIKVTTNKLEKGPHTELKLEPCSPNSYTVSPEWSLTNKSLGRGI